MLKTRFKTSSQKRHPLYQCHAKVHQNYAKISEFSTFRHARFAHRTLPGNATRHPVYKCSANVHQKLRFCFFLIANNSHYNRLHRMSRIYLIHGRELHLIQSAYRRPPTPHPKRSRDTLRVAAAVARPTAGSIMTAKSKKKCQKLAPKSTSLRVGQFLCREVHLIQCPPAAVARRAAGSLIFFNNTKDEGRPSPIPSPYLKRTQLPDFPTFRRARPNALA